MLGFSTSLLLRAGASVLPGWLGPVALVKKGLDIGVKHLKYFIDSHFREHVVPVPGSVLYCDLLVAAEHSGIYLDDNRIVNVEVDSLLTADSTVRYCSPASFTAKSPLGRKIYVSSDQHGPVGHSLVARGAKEHVGDRHLYLLLMKNCHAFSRKCLSYINYDSETSLLAGIAAGVHDGTSGMGGISDLKADARKKIGATKWYLWDWDGSIKNNLPSEPDWDTVNEQFSQLSLTPENVEKINQELAEMQSYLAEVEDENIPQNMRDRLQSFQVHLQKIQQAYDKNKSFFSGCPGAGLSYADLQNLSNEDFIGMAEIMRNNPAIRELARKMGRAYISEERKKQGRVPEASRSEIHGTQRNDDVMRMLPSELLNLEDETLEHLFYARLLEKQLLTYELQGTMFKQGETTETHSQRTGPVVACLDTSGSMAGQPMLKAKALLLSVANILKAERRSMHVILFGNAGETREFELSDAEGIGGLLGFLRQGFGGGTDFETPLRQAIKIIAENPTYEKADVLMISDGDCTLNEAFTETLSISKASLNCMVYSVLCNGRRVNDSFSDEVVVL